MESSYHKKGNRSIIMSDNMDCPDEDAFFSEIDKEMSKLMTEVKPARYEEIAASLGKLHQYHGGRFSECVYCWPIDARINQDRATIERLTRERDDERKLRRELQEALKDSEAVFYDYSVAANPCSPESKTLRNARSILRRAAEHDAKNKEGE